MNLKEGVGVGMGEGVEVKLEGCGVVDLGVDGGVDLVWSRREWQEC